MMTMDRSIPPEVVRACCVSVRHRRARNAAYNFIAPLYRIRRTISIQLARRATRDQPLWARSGTLDKWRYGIIRTSAVSGPTADGTFATIQPASIMVICRDFGCLSRRYSHRSGSKFWRPSKPDLRIQITISVVHRILESRLRAQGAKKAPRDQGENDEPHSCVAAASSVCPDAQFFLPTSSSARGIPQNIPRKELLILENPEGTIKNAGWFNIWPSMPAPNPTGCSRRHSIRSGTSIRKAGSMASGTTRSPPTAAYNADFTEIDRSCARHFLERRRRFTADDVISDDSQKSELRFSAC